MMALQQLPWTGFYLLNPVRTRCRRSETAVCEPPSFDAPETTGFVDTRTRSFFRCGLFRGAMKDPAEMATDMAPDDLQKGRHHLDDHRCPWLATADRSKWIHSMGQGSGPRTKCHSEQHLHPPRASPRRSENTLPRHSPATPFTGPDQAALEALDERLREG